MAIKLTALGGTDYADGDTGFAQDWVDTFEAGLIHRKVFTDATVYTHTGDTNFTNQTSFTFGALNALVIGMSVKLSLKSSNTGNAAEVRMSLTGSNLGTFYLNQAGKNVDGGTSTIFGLSLVVHTNSAIGLNNATSTSKMLGGPVGIHSLKLLDASTTVNFDLRIDSAAQTATLQDIFMDIFYVKNFVED